MRFHALTRPVFDINGAMALIGRNEDAICALLDDGQLSGVDISRPGSSRRCMRVFTRSIEAFLNKEETPAGIDLLHEVFPAFRDAFYVHELSRKLNCGTLIIYNLHRAGALKKPHAWPASCRVPEKERKRFGYRKDPLQFTRVSIIGFLTPRTS